MANQHTGRILDSREVRDLHAGGMSIRAIAVRLGVSQRRIQQTLKTEGVGTRRQGMYEDPLVRACARCKAIHPATTEFFHKNANMPHGLHTYCKTCRNTEQTVYQKNQVLKSSTAYNRRARDKALETYGGSPPACACCGESHREFLAIDHINGDGAAHRKEIGGSSTRMYAWLRRNNYPPGFRVLCHNCNASLGHYGYCPHRRLGEHASEVVRPPVGGGQYVGTIAPGASPLL